MKLIKQNFKPILWCGAANPAVLEGVGWSQRQKINDLILFNCHDTVRPIMLHGIVDIRTGSALDKKIYEID
jgi:hypothetical protein